MDTLKKDTTQMSLVFMRRFDERQQSTQYGHELPEASTEKDVFKETNLATNLK